MEMSDNLIYLCVLAAVIGAALFAWLAYDSPSVAFIWAILHRS
jgi:hypothetical protein